MSTIANVTAAKPKVGGAVYTGPAGTPLPTDATTDLNAAFKALGFVSDDGLTNSNTAKSEKIKAWGGTVVNSVQTEKEDTFTYKLIEALNVEVLKEVYGAENVTGKLSTGIKIEANSKELPVHPIIIETLLQGAVKRIVLPAAKVSEVGEIKYADSDNVGYELTVQALPDEKENTHYEYIKSAATSTPSSS